MGEALPLYFGKRSCAADWLPRYAHFTLVLAYMNPWFTTTDENPYTFIAV